MKLVRFLYQNTPRYGRLVNNQVQMISGNPFDKVEPSGLSMNRDKVELLAPVEPSKIVAVGLNYRDHAEELGMDIPKEPILFLKPPSSVIGPGQSVEIGRASCRERV